MPSPREVAAGTASVRNRNRSGVHRFLSALVRGGQCHCVRPGFGVPMTRNLTGAHSAIAKLPLPAHDARATPLLSSENHHVINLRGYWAVRESYFRVTYEPATTGQEKASANSQAPE